MGIKPHDHGCWGSRGNIFTLQDLDTPQANQSAAASSSSVLKSECTAKVARYALGFLFGLGFILSIVTFIAAAATLPLGTVTILIMVTQAAFAAALAFKLYDLFKHDVPTCSITSKA